MKAVGMEESMLCPNCKKEVSDNIVFCNCGYNVYKYYKDMNTGNEVKIGLKSQLSDNKIVKEYDFGENIGKVTSIICINCKAENLDNAKFCSQCGSPIVSPPEKNTNQTEKILFKYCNQCGNKMQLNDVFCDKCGNNRIGPTGKVVNDATTNNPSTKNYAAIGAVIGFIIGFGICFAYFAIAASTSSNNDEYLVGIIFGVVIGVILAILGAIIGLGVQKKTT